MYLDILLHMKDLLQDWDFSQDKLLYHLLWFRYAAGSEDKMREVYEKRWKVKTNEWKPTIL